MQRFSIILLNIFLISCTSQPGNTPGPISRPSIANEAHQTLIRFFALLNEKKYSESDLLHGGSYEKVRGWNPDIDPSEHAVLLAGACGYIDIQLI